jgi:AAA domain
MFLTTSAAMKLPSGCSHISKAGYHVDAYLKKIEDELKPPPPPVRLLKTSAAFIESLEPPDYVIDGIIRRRFLYSLCGKTGSAKTAIMLLLAAHIALGLKLGNREVEKGNGTLVATY